MEEILETPVEEAVVEEVAEVVEEETVEVAEPAAEENFSENVYVPSDLEDTEDDEEDLRAGRGGIPFRERREHEGYAGTNEDGNTRHNAS